MAHSHRINTHEQKKQRFEAWIVFLLAGLIVAVVAAFLFIAVPKTLRPVPDIKAPPPAPIHNLDSAT